MRLLVISLGFLCSLFITGGRYSYAQIGIGGEQPYPDFGDIQAQYNSYNLDMLGNDLVGDHIDIDTGALSLTQMDVSIPGNNALPVEFGRTKSRGTKGAWLGGWAPTIPSISRNYLASVGANLDRCTGDLYPITWNWPTHAGLQYDITAETFFNGYSLSVPGRSPGELSQANNGVGNPASPEFAGLNAVMVSKNNWYISCGVTASDGGEGFVATAPNGDEYTFTFRKTSQDRAVTFPAIDSSLPTPPNPLYPFNASADHMAMTETLYATELKDVHGNWVKYEYSGGKPSRIYSNDGREITFGYSGSKITSVNANGRSWIYQYNGNGSLSGVVLPDGRSWTISTESFALERSLTGICAFTGSPEMIGEVTITHPSGTSAEFEFNVIKNGRTYMQIVETSYDFPPPTIDSCPVNYTSYYPERTSPTGFWSFAVTKKTLTLSSGETLVWTRDYEQDSGTYSDASSHPPDTKKRTVTDPDGKKTVFHVNRRFGYLEGSLMKTEVIPSGSSTPVRTTTNSYQVGNIVGIELSGQGYGGTSNGSKVTRIYQTQTVTSQDGDTFTKQNTYQTNPAAADFAYGKPKTSSAFSNVSSTPRVTETTYINDTTNWILGLPDVIEINGREEVDYDYNSVGQKVTERRYGEDFATYAYHGYHLYKGALFWVQDPEGYRTEYRDYKRGTAERLRQGYVGSAFRDRYQYVDDNGWVIRSKDFRGNETLYDRDEMGRLTQIDPPGSYFVNTNISYDFSGGGAVQSITKGHAETTITYDGLMRPILKKQRSANNGWVSYVATEYDANSQVSFKSFPSASSNPTTGVTYTYDALGRPKTQTENVAPNAQTTFHYFNNHRTRVTDPEGFMTMKYFDGYGGPGAGALLRIDEAAGTKTALVRNIWGQVDRVDQWGTSGGVYDVKRTYYKYDSQQRVCLTFSSDVRHTLFDYYDNGLLKAYAEGQSKTTCGVPNNNDRVDLTYDAFRRKQDTQFTDPGTPNIRHLYDRDDNVAEVRRAGYNWFYTYDEMSNLKSETLDAYGRVYTFDYAYYNNGFRYQDIYPSGRIVRRAMDGYDKDRTVYSPAHSPLAGNVIYADDIEWHPNGVMKRLDFESGFFQQQNLNARQQITWIGSGNGSATAMNMGYAYNARGLIESVSDNQHNNHRTYGYDGQGRLISATGPWNDALGLGNATVNGTFTYDAIGNILSKTLGNRTVTMNYNYNYDRITSYTDTHGPNKTLTYAGPGNVTRLGDIYLNYDKTNQVTSITGADTGVYIYDGNLKRVKSVVNGTTLYNVYNAAGQLKIVDNATTGELTEYIHGAGQTIAEIDVDNSAGTEERRYLHNDILGTPRAATGLGAPVQKWKRNHTPFGERIVDNAAFDNKLGYTGHIEDETGLTYMQARYYDPVMGRFLSKDPVTFMGSGMHPGHVNRYAYTYNNPVNATDPDGEFAQFIAKFAVDVALEVAIQAASGEDIDLGAATKSAAVGLIDPTKTARRVAKLGKLANTARKARKTCCFVAGTLVETEDGLRPIDEIQVGDMVLARDEKTGETALKTVTDLIPRHTRQIWEVTFEGENGASEFFETTDDHPWWVVSDNGEGDWVNTADLTDGMRVTTADNVTMAISSVVRTDRVDSTYNITVADFETYFVGENKVLVHNCPTGSYTNTHASGKTYDGKGDPSRAAKSGKDLAKTHKDPVVNTETRTASSDRESFKQESRSLDANGGPKSDSNYNKIESPGKRYRRQDGEIN